MLARAQRLAGDHDSEFPSLLKATGLGSKKSYDWFLLAVYYGWRGEEKKSIAASRRGFELLPKSRVAAATVSGARLGLSSMLVRVGRFEEARRVLDLEKETVPESKLAKRYESIRIYLALEQRLEKVLAGEDKPADKREGIRFGNLCFYLGRPADAMRFYRVHEPEQPSYLPNAACSAARTKDLSRALSWLDRVLATRSN